MTTSPDTPTSYPGAPTGHVRTTERGAELVIERTFRAAIDHVWAALTEPDRFARWYGTLDGVPQVGETVMVTMTYEEGAAPEPALIVECAPPRRLVVELGVGATPWRLAVDLAERDGVTVLTFVQPVTPGVDVVDVGPGWEYYIDRLTAVVSDLEMPHWQDDGYQAALGPHYRTWADAD
jgi:uncharacterized protein YndB with AHSA1/START domain